MSEQPDRPSQPKRAGWLFQCAALATVAFIVTVLSLIATVFADPNAPVNVWLNDNATRLLLLEVAAIVGFALAAMWRDQANGNSERGA